MSSLIPKISTKSLTGIWTGRSSVSGVFLKRHRQAENLKAIESQVRENDVYLSPKEWLLLIEGHGRRYRATVENEFIHILSDNYDLRVEDPIVNPFTSTIANEVSLDRIHAATSILVSDYLGDLDLSRLDEVNSREVIRLAAEVVAKQFDVNPRSVRKQFSRLSFTNEERLKTEIDTMLNIRQRLIDRSNELSREQLEEILSRNNEPNVLIMTGGAHEEVFEPTFQNNKGAEHNPIFIPSNELTTLPNKQNLVYLNAEMEKKLVLAAADAEACIKEVERRNEERRLNKIFSNPNPTWEDFLYLYEKYRTSYFFPIMTLQAMIHVVERTSPKLLGHTYSESALLHTATRDPENPSQGEKALYYIGKILCFAVGNPTHPKIIIDQESFYAARTLRFIVEKIGNQLPDEINILNHLLLAPNKRVRLEGTQALLNSSKHNWRHDRNTVLGFTNKLSDLRGNERALTERAIVSADPSFLFITYDTGDFVIYRGKDVEIEKILIACAKENDPKIREKAFGAIYEYQEKGNAIASTELDGLLIKGIENKDGNAAIALSARFRNRKLNNPDILPYLVKYFDNPEVNDITKIQYFGTFGILLLQQHIIEPRLKPLARKNLQNKDLNVRVHATNIFALLTHYENPVNLERTDIPVLFELAESDPSDLVKNNSTYALSLIVNKNIDLFTLEQLDKLENDCIRNRFPTVGADFEIRVIDETRETLERFSALKDLALLTQLDKHSTRPEVERLIKQKERYRLTITLLLNRMQKIEEANEKLKRKVAGLRDEAKDLKKEVRELKTAMEGLVKELEDHKMQLESKHINRLLWTIGGGAIKSMAFGGAHFIPELAMDLTLELLPAQLPSFTQMIDSISTN